MTLEMVGILVKFVAVALALCLLGCWAVDEWFDLFV